jgi:phage FluMu gp28-like protein
MNRTLRSRSKPSETRSPEVARDIRFLLRPYQAEAFDNRTNGIECWLWGRQTGKSFTLAAWAVDRLITRPGRLVTILSNSLANGVELNQKCAEIARRYAGACEQNGLSHLRFDTMDLEIRLVIGENVSRIKILPANPRTARGFSGDLILDEFAFHENAAAIWEAAEPILSANADYLCRVASTPNGRHNMFYRLATDPRIPIRRVTRTDAWLQGLIIAHPITRQPISPVEARSLAHDKRAYDQNYECVFDSENMSLLPLDLISQAEDPTVGHICEDEWSPAALELLAHSKSAASKNLYVGVDVGRTRDLTVVSVIEKVSGAFFVRLILRLRNMRLPAQQALLEIACRSPRFAAAFIDMTGLGLGLFEYTHQRFGDRIHGVNFASTIPFPNVVVRDSNRSSASAKAPEILALTLLQAFESRRIRIPVDPELRDDLRLPERVTSPTGAASISAARNGSGHADHFWSFALAIYGAQSAPAPLVHVPHLRSFLTIHRDRFC